MDPHTSCSVHNAALGSVTCQVIIIWRKIMYVQMFVERTSKRSKVRMQPVQKYVVSSVLCDCALVFKDQGRLIRTRI